MKNEALGGDKLQKFTLLVKATLINLFETHSPGPKFQGPKVIGGQLGQDVDQDLDNRI